MVCQLEYRRTQQHRKQRRRRELLLEHRQVERPQRDPRPPHARESDTGRINYSGPTPPSAVTFPGSHHTLRVEARNTLGTVTYQWKKDGVAIPDATNTYYEIRRATSADDGEYSCVISDQSPATVETGTASFAVFDAAQLPAASVSGLFCIALAALFLGARQLLKD